MYQQYIDRVLRFIFVIVVIFSGYFIAKFSFIYFYPFIIAIIFSIILNPSVTFLEVRLKLPRTIATFISLTLFLFLGVICIVIIINELIQGTSFLAAQIPTHFQDFMALCKAFFHSSVLPLYDKFTTFFNTLDSSQQQTIESNLDKLTNQITTTGTIFIKGLLLKIPETLSLLPSSLTIFTVTLIATFLVTKDWTKLKMVSVKAFPVLKKPTVNHFLILIKSSMIGFFKAQLILIVLTAGCIYIGLTLLDVKYALTIAILAALLDLLPYIGTGIIFIPWIFYLFITADYTLTIKLSILYMIIIVVRQIIEPKLISSSIGLTPLTTLFIMFVALNIWGVIGLFISPILLIFWNACYQTKVVTKLYLFVKGS
ncbi:sporulation integral membrane protein YtvI [Virgibacillus flavescens]|uniref:sporulation integral membrane protein YtvI n=1 Tax=Virgibacillus flavescens TaxID=1611422 RepID=UPI003D35818B